WSLVLGLFSIEFGIPVDVIPSEARSLGLLPSPGTLKTKAALAKDQGPTTKDAFPMPNEVEIKFRIDNLRAIASRLRNAGFRLLTRRTHEMNTLYDLPGEVLRRRGELLRLRKYGKEWLLTHKAKGRVGRHKTRVETETKVADGAKMESIIVALGYS